MTHAADANNKLNLVCDQALFISAAGWKKKALSPVSERQIRNNRRHQSVYFQVKAQRTIDKKDIGLYFARLLFIRAETHPIILARDVRNGR